MLDPGISSLHASIPSPVSFFSSLQIWDILIKDVTQLETIKVEVNREYY